MVEAAVHNGQFFYNVTDAVGEGQPNQMDDVDLVRFGFYMLNQAHSPLFKRVERVLNELRPIGLYDYYLRNAIVAFQEVQGGTKDGRVSKARPIQYGRSGYDGKHEWMILALNAFMRDFDLYPRIDTHPMCGGMLKQRIKMIFRGY